MHRNHLRQLLYSSGAITVLGVLLAIFALDRINSSSLRADVALEFGTSAISAGGGPGVTPTARPALVEFEHANREASQATLLLSLAATLTPLLVFLNVLGFAGQHAPGANDSRLRTVALGKDGTPDPTQLDLID